MYSFASTVASPSLADVILHCTFFVFQLFLLVFTAFMQHAFVLPTNSMFVSSDNTYPVSCILVSVHVSPQATRLLLNYISFFI